MINLQNIEILIPSYNEAKNLPHTIKSLHDHGLKNITILDAKSDDGTEEVAEKFNCKILIDPKKRMGFGYSLTNGIKKSKSKYLCIFDADGSFDPKSILEMHKLLEERNIDFVFGSRYLDGNKSDDDTFVTTIGNYFFTQIINILFNFKTSDALFLYLFGKTECFQKLNLKEKDFKICTEILIKAHTFFKCREIFSYEAPRLHGETKVNRLLDGFKILINILAMYFKIKLKKL